MNSATTKVRVLAADSLYLAWMDCRGETTPHRAIRRYRASIQGRR